MLDNLTDDPSGKEWSTGEYQGTRHAHRSVGGRRGSSPSNRQGERVDLRQAIAVATEERDRCEAKETASVKSG